MVGVLEEKNIKKINCCKSCVEFKRCGYCKFFSTFIDAQDEACSYYEERVEVISYREFKSRLKELKGALKHC